MSNRLTRIQAEGLRSLRDFVPRPRLTVLVDPEGSAMRDLVTFFALLRELAFGRLQQTQLLDAVDGPVTLVLGVDDDDYSVTLRRFPDGRWRVVQEELSLLAGISIPFVEPGSSREEAVLSTFPPGPTVRMGDTEAAWLGEIADSASRAMNGFLRGFRVQPAESFDANVPFLFLEERDVDLPSNAVWDRVQAARAASSRVPVLLCTPSVALADAFDLEDVLRVG
ncbi:hypothetical protein COCOR_07853 [Corallococcus coralloides DSM 2259]|uniref:Uncharacterized protein n=1 Tax=Corallococcus coralloides (strain ATCC 25202 / DSM 2259 / NBRC 100086 / M2) TaxID=1144275 RepID=H8MUX8_CORCM|nr:hypothetical protein [Corallococcus coralloides]AFE07777.1 hypothetical protein COCOR_07853 [Corallococcus coralloides DSM 2259]